jgi:hypothetical protein
MLITIRRASSHVNRCITLRRPGFVLKIGHTQAPARSCLQTLFRYDAGETFPNRRRKSCVALQSQSLSLRRRSILARRMFYWRRLQQLQTSLLLFKDFQPPSLQLSRIACCLATRSRRTAKLRPSHTAPGPGQLNLCSPQVERYGERGMPGGLHFDPASLSNELRPPILNSWSMIDNKAQSSALSGWRAGR